MSSDLLRHQDEDQYFYTSQYDQNQDGVASSGSFMPYQAYQAQSNVPDTTPITQSINGSAFNTNSQLLTSTPNNGEHSRSYHSQNVYHSPLSHPPTAAHGSFSTPLVLPGLLNAISAHKSDIEPQATRENPIASASANGGGSESIEQVDSDLEEGELSEGTHHISPVAHTPSRPQSAQQPSLKAHGTVTKEKRPRESPYMAPRSDSLVQGATKGNRSGASGTEVKHRRQYQTVPRTVQSTANGQATSNLARQAYGPSIARRQKSFKVVKGGARRAVKQLQSHNVSYLQLLEEHIDSDLLKRLFAELNVKPPESTQVGVSPATTESQTAPSDTAREHNLISGSKQSISAPITEKSVPVKTNVSLPQDQQRMYDAKAAENLVTNKPNEVREGQSNRGYKLAMGLDKAGKDRVPLLTKTNNDIEPVKSQSQENGVSSPAANGGEPAITQTVFHAPAQSSTTTSTMSKPPAPKVAAKPVDRKDYVARLLAAKAGKALPAMNGSKPSSYTTPQSVGQEPAPGTNNQADRVDEADSVHVQNKNAPRVMDASSEVNTNTGPQKLAAAEAKKRAQTELARRKIEELKQRSEAQKTASMSTKGAPLSPATKQSSPNEKPTRAPAIGITLSTTGSPFVLNTPQHSYFPLQNTTFTLPGLFMSSQQSQPKPRSQLVPLAPGSDMFQTSEPKPETGKVSRTGVVVDPEPHEVETLAPSDQENKVPVQAPIAEGMTPRAISNSRKRPTAADFTEPVPVKSRRVHASKAEESVVFDISDDEVAESVHDSSEMPMDSDQGIEHQYAKGLQSSGLGIIEHADFRQHPALGDSVGRLEPFKSTPSVSLQTSQGITKQKEPGGLKSNEEEIARMKRKIAEMEDRRKSKQTASPAQTPGTPGQLPSSVKPSESHASISNLPALITRLSESANQIRDGEGMPEDVQNTESTMQMKAPAEQPVDDVRPMEALQIAARNINDSANDIGHEQQQSQRRRADIESRIQSVSAAVELHMAKLHNLRRERASVQAQLQKEGDDRRALQEELDRLLQAPTPNVEASKHGSQQRKSFQTTAHIQDTNPHPSHQKQQDEEPLSVEQSGDTILGTPQNDRMTPGRTIAPESSTPENTMSAEAPTDESLVSGELADDVMDISGSEDESEDSATGYSPEPDGYPAPPAIESDNEEIYEPPQSFGLVQEETMNPADWRQHHPEQTESSQQSARGLKPLTPPVEISGTSNARDGVKADASVALSPLPSERAPNPIYMSDSDDYEPPEPMSSVEAEPLTNDAATSSTRSSFSPRDANPATEDETASHVQLSVSNEQVGNDLVETRPPEPEEANDLILVQMGAVPEGLSAEQKDAFVVGLRQIIQEIRGRKVKDFRTVASEIAAYRARFLGDNSKILPL